MAYFNSHLGNMWLCYVPTIFLSGENASAAVRLYGEHYSYLNAKCLPAVTRPWFVPRAKDEEDQRIRKTCTTMYVLAYFEEDPRRRANVAARRSVSIFILFPT